MSVKNIKPELPRGVEEFVNPSIASSRWGTTKDIEHSEGILLKGSLEEIAAKGALFLGATEDGRYIGYRDDRHCLTVAGSRAGKGTALIIPNLLLYPGSVLCLDPKGENARLTAARRRRMGQTVYVLDPFGISGEEASATYNPLGDLDPYSDTLVDDAALIADSLIAERNTRDPHWNEAARELIKGLLLHVRLNLPFEDQQTLIEVRRILRDPTLLGGTLHDMTAPNTISDTHDVIRAVASSYNAKPERERDSVLSTARRHTEFLDSEGMQRVLRNPPEGGHDLSSLRKLRDAYRSSGGKPVTVYLCLPAMRMTTHARWLRLVVNLALALFEQDAQQNPDREPHNRPPVLFLLDEFSSLENMPALSLAAGLMAGYGLKLWPFLQDLSQLKTHYESSWETFIGNAGLHIFFGNTDTTTLKYISERLGKVRVKRSSHSGQRANTLNDDSRISVSFSDDVTPLLSPDEVQRIFSRNKTTGGFMVALLPGTLPTWLRKIEWYSNDPLKAIQRDSNTHTEPSTQKNTSLWNRMTSR